MRKSLNGRASASQADSRGFDSRLSLQRPISTIGLFRLRESNPRVPAGKEVRAFTCSLLQENCGFRPTSLPPSKIYRIFEGFKSGYFINIFCLYRYFITQYRSYIKSFCNYKLLPALAKSLPQATFLNASRPSFAP